MEDEKCILQQTPLLKDACNFKEEEKSNHSSHTRDFSGDIKSKSTCNKLCQNTRGKRNFSDERMDLTHVFSAIQTKMIREHENIKTVKKKKFALGIMLFYIVIYFFVSATLLIANCQDQDIIEKEYDTPFHFLDFWGSFIFACVEVSILSLASMLEFGSLRFFIGLIGIGTTLITAILFSFNQEFWGLPCHWLEFSAQIFLTISDLFFILNQFKNKDNILYKYRYIEVSLVILLLCASVVKLLVFGDIFGFPQAERVAHFIEFTGEMTNAIFAFLFTYLLYKECENQLDEILEKDKLVDV